MQRVVLPNAGAVRIGVARRNRRLADLCTAGQGEAVMTAVPLEPLELFPAPECFRLAWQEYQAASKGAASERQAPAPDPAPVKPRRQRRTSLARLVAKAKQLGVDVTIESDGTATFRTSSSAADSMVNEWDEVLPHGEH